MQLLCKCCLLTLLITFSIPVIAQSEIGRSKKFIREMLEHDVKDTVKYPHRYIVETDSSIAFISRDTALSPTQFIYLFNAKGKCTSKILTGCSRCYDHHKEEMLGLKKYRWVQILPYEYVSSFNQRLFLTTYPGKNGGSIVIKKAGWSRKSYASLVAQSRRLG